MKEFELKKTLEQEIEIPTEVEERIQMACAQAKSAPRAVRQSRRSLRTALVAAAVIAALGVSAAAAYVIVRGEIAVEKEKVLESFFGNESYPSVAEQTAYHENGTMILNLPNEERVPVDREQAQTLVGDYLPETGYVWQIEDYTLTVESYLLDENTGTAKISYILHRPGGVEGVVITPEDGEAWVDGSGITLYFCVLVDETWEHLHSRVYADQSRSTGDTLYLTASLARDGGWSAADGLRIEFCDLRLNDKSHRDVSLVATLELPEVKSLPAVTVTDPETGEPAAVISSIGMKLWVGDTDVDSIDYIALSFADGSEYVLRDDAFHIRNTSYEVGSDGQAYQVRDPESGRFVWVGKLETRAMHYCFNRLVDPEQVVGVTIDGQYYAYNR